MKKRECIYITEVNFDQLSKRSSPLTANYIIRGVLYLSCRARNWFIDRIS